MSAQAETKMPIKMEAIITAAAGLHSCENRPPELLKLLNVLQQQINMSPLSEQV